ncbi:Transglutaminase-like superfamily protein [Mariprofundus ferrinatatus]|uniref:Transglutaminase-like superfamily protein n=1 Tax=Mariprofundus ferrinatatus TaxID=1921087 RepID=A0A2K8L5V9_9PROT|nr:Transglutaminase-like superfamily protein [Mariprofundus ferrinatatus]
MTLAVLLCGVAALALSDFVSPFYWLLSVVAALFRLWRGPEFKLSEMQASLVGWFGFVWVILELFLGRELVVAFTDFLLILAFAIVVEAATPRNHLHRMLVGVFLVLAGAVLTDSVLYVLPLFAMMWSLWRAASCLYGLNWQGGDLALLPLRQEMRWMLLMMAVTGLLFVILPRFEFHSLLKAAQPRMETSGFSDLVQLGDFARTLDARIAMRVEPVDLTADGVADFQKWAMGRYWRGSVLSRFTGNGWQKVVSKEQFHLGRGEDFVAGGGESIRVAMYREASDHAYIQLPQGLIRIHDLPQPVRFDSAMAVQFAKAPSRRLRLLMDVASSRELAVMPEPQGWERSQSNIPDAVRSWVAQFSKEGSGQGEALSRVAAELRSWDYDLNAPIDAARPVESFLNLKRGHCELYATMLALAARTLGIPSRVVNGYLGGDWNEVGEFLQVRHLNAHSWVEVWLNGRWQRMDATPAARSGLLEISFPTLEQLWESVKLGWYRYVLEFQNSDRVNFIRALWQSLRVYGEWLLSGVLATGILLIFWRYGKRLRLLNKRKQVGSLWPELDHWLTRRGVVRPPHVPLRSAAVPEGVNHDLWRRFVRQWEAQVYGKEAVWKKSDLKRHLRALLKSY